MAVTFLGTASVSGALTCVECYKLLTGVCGPLPSGTTVILGRSGLTSQGFIVHPDILARNIKEEIKIGTYVKKEMQMDAGDRIVELLFPYIKDKAAPVESTGALGEYWKMCVLENSG